MALSKAPCEGRDGEPGVRGGGGSVKSGLLIRSCSTYAATS